LVLAARVRHVAWLVLVWLELVLAAGAGPFVTAEEAEQDARNNQISPLLSRRKVMIHYW
jgi:hypothetical protein